MRDMELKDEIALAHRGLGSWVAVAPLCGTNPKTGAPYSATMAWWWGSGQRAIPSHVADAWYASVSRDTLKSWEPRRRKARVSIECSPDTRDALRNSIKKHSDTWDAAFDRILKDTEFGSAAHLFTLLDKRTLETMVDELEAAIYAHGPDGYYLTDPEIVGVQWLLDRAQLELSCRQAPDWARKD